MNPRPYQADIIKAAAHSVAKNKRIIVQAATGAGKSVVFSFIIKRHLKSNAFNRVLVLTHREELFKQSRSKIQTISEKPVAKLKAGMRVGRHHSEASIVVSMVETLKRRDLSKLGEFTLVIVDEAHRNDFLGVLDQLPESTMVLGFTATPISANKEKPLKNTYKSIVCGPPLHELINMGYLTTPIHYKAEFKGKNLRKRMGEFTAKSQISELERQPVYQNLVELWKQKAHGRKTIVFNVNKKHTIETNDKFRLQGIKSEHILSGDKQRDSKFNDFINGKFDVLNMCEIGTTGIDIPDIGCIVVNLATQSLVKIMQILGRGGRIAPGKDNCIFLDFGGNIDRHGMWHLQRDWKDIFYNPPEKSIAPAPMKECPSCGALSFGGAGQCEVCGHAFKHKIENKEQQTVVGYLRKVGSEDIIGKRIDDLSISQLVDLAESGKYKMSYVFRVARTRGEEELKQLAKIRGYSNGWLYHQRSQPKGYKNYKVKLN